MASTSLDIDLTQYFTKSVKSINKLRDFVAQRKEFLQQTIPASIKTMTAAVVKKQIDANPLDSIVRSINDHVTENHVALIKLLNMEELLWTELKNAVEAGDKKDIGRILTGIDAVLDNELRLIPATAQLQAVFLKMTPEQMERAARLK